MDFNTFGRIFWGFKCFHKLTIENPINLGCHKGKVGGGGVGKCCHDLKPWKTGVLTSFLKGVHSWGRMLKIPS